MTAQDRALDKLRRRFVAIFVAVGGLFLLLAYGAIFASNIVQTDVAIDEKLSEALDRAPFPPSEENDAAIQAWLARNSCMIVVDVSGGDHEGTHPFNADDIEADKLQKILTELKSSEDKDADFEIDGSYFRSHRQIEIVDEASGSVTVYSVYDWTADRADLIESGVMTGVVYLFCLVLLYIFGQLVSRQIIAPVKQSYEQQKQLVADASHELKTPLAIIGANMYLIKSDPAATVGDNEHWIDNVDAQLTRMSALIADMLELFRADSEAGGVKTKEDLSEMLDGVLLSFEARCFEKNIELTQNISPDITFECYAKQMERLFNILMDNALKYTPEEGKIDVELRSDKRVVTAVFTNYGAGIAKEHLTKIFDRFYRVDNARTQSAAPTSFGLGLSLAKNIALAHDGEIECDSDGTTYTEFTVRLPKGGVLPAKLKIKKNAKE